MKVGFVGLGIMGRPRWDSAAILKVIEDMNGRTA
jgi:hypothetical protein